MFQSAFIRGHKSPKPVSASQTNSLSFSLPPPIVDRIHNVPPQLSKPDPQQMRITSSPQMWRATSAGGVENISTSRRCNTSITAIMKGAGAAPKSVFHYIPDRF